MGLRINTNIMAMDAYRNLSQTNSNMESSLQKLSSGFRINRASDDAAGLSISEGLRSQIGGLQQAMQNTQDGISVLQTAEGALNEVHSLLHRVRDLAVEAANTAANDTNARNAIQSEVSQALSTIDNIAQSTKYGSQQLLSSTGATNTFTFQVGSDGSSYSQVAATLNTVATATLGNSAGNTAGLSAVATAIANGQTSAIATIDNAISEVSTDRATIGAYQNQLQHTLANLGVSKENLSASESRIRDTDMASEMVNFTKNQILSQAGISMLAQANAAPQSVLKLLG